jgi:proliferating cell nuclear antigen
MNIAISNTQKAECFASLFQHIKLLTDQINIVFDHEKMHVQSMDHARVSIFDINIPRSWFDEYIVDEGQSSVTLGISSSLFFRILNIRDKLQTMRFNYFVNSEQGESDKLFVHFSSDVKQLFDKYFEIPLLDLESDIITVPEFEYAAELAIPSTYFASIISQFKLFGDTLEVHCNEDKVVLSSMTIESGKMTVEVGIDDLTEFAIDEGAVLNLSFSLTYLNTICLYNRLAKDIQIKVSDNYPMRIDYDIGEGASVTFYLAPKIDD